MDKAGKQQKTRISAIIEGGADPTYPPITSCDYMIGYLFEAGPVMSDTMGSAPLSNMEIRAWQDNTGASLTPWEARLLRSLSREYLCSSQAAETPSCPPPWGDSDDGKNIRAEELQRKIDAFLN